MTDSNTSPGAICRCKEPESNRHGTFCFACCLPVGDPERDRLRAPYCDAIPMEDSKPWK